ncbi:hypothetical protein C488_20722 [Natrinema pellirubrum DSM 15624]|jgi:hypothetical protein|uniref:Uncharacterized protein n=1 Tax=Natrinema pellirubrum (strain DSM 15624 / CIP 106293 / JCM 10476 / NCIMB 786 / 157) TaxID=797303 RepID=L0JR22_NATP1|nr:MULTISPECIES: hypothetical protein [Halobacteria]AGB33965.1 hypothetical protein Natpe_4262 [Natrinema pellirubrum DSM 15624]ELY69150.1 hypothetical protein C488_20722 [Natrinema pellirubrum DSM 15624]MDL0133434.1 hypothetical protein [Halobacterium salinarum]
MSRNTVNTTVSIKPADALFLSWATGINASGLFREALTEQMTYRDIDRDELSTLAEEALTDTSRDLEDLLEQTSSIDDLNALLETDPSTD